MNWSLPTLLGLAGLPLELPGFVMIGRDRRRRGDDRSALALGNRALG